MVRARARLDMLTKPQGSLGRLEDIASFMCGWQQTLAPSAARAQTLVFAGNHGVAARGVSAYPPEVTAQMVANFAGGGAAINQLCNAFPSTLTVVPLSLEEPTGDISTEPAMSAEECELAFTTGAQSVDREADILILGEMGIGNTTPAAAIACFLAGGAPDEWVGRGTGIDEAHLQIKAASVDNAVALHRQDITSTASLLARLGGRELAAMAGAAHQARRYRIPVILDGYVATAAASALTFDHPEALAHCLAGHRSVEPGHGRLLAHLNLNPLLDLGMRLGEGTGAQLALGLVRAALACFTGMATFDGAGVSGKD